MANERGGERTPARFVLASASPARLRLLRSVGIDPEVVVSGVPEHDVAGAPAEVALELARRKAHAVAGSISGAALVLGCDSLLDLAGRALGKPSSPAQAVARWHEMRGRSARLRTGHCLVSVSASGTLASASEVASTAVRFGVPSDEEVEAYVATGEPLGVAGAFTLDGRSGAFIEGVEGCPSNVIGCSLPVLRRLLARFGWSIDAWWRAPADGPG